LKEDGSLSFVLPAAWEYALYAEHLRQNVFRNFQSVDVHRCLEPLFPDVREGCVVLVARKYKQRPRGTRSIDHATSRLLVAFLGRKSPNLDLKPQKPHKPLMSPAEPAGVAFSDLYHVGIGCVTGDAGYFLLTEADRISHNLPVEAVRPILSKARHLTSAQMTRVHWKRLLDANERVWLFSPGSSTLRHKTVRAYLEYGKLVCDLNGYKLKHRDPWYEVRDIRNATGFLSGMTRLGPWISFRATQHLAASNTLYVLTAKARMTSDEHSAWGLSLLSSSSRRQFAELTRRYPDGLAKLEPHDLSSFQLSPPKSTAGAAEKYSRAVDLLLASRVSEAVAIADAQIGGRCTLRKVS